MATASVTFWEILNDEVLRFRFDHLLSCPVSRDGLRCLAPVLLFLFICFLALSRFRSVLKDEHARTRLALQALVAIVVPTCSVWPGRYIKFASVLSSHIDIPLEVIIRDTIDGLIEFRNQIDDLADLIDSGATVNGHTISLTVGWRWWFGFFKWWMVGEYKSDWLHHNMPPASSSPQSRGQFRPFALPSSDSRPVSSLDYLPRNETPSLNADCKVILEFTAFSPSVRLLSSAHIISAIPFMVSHRPYRRPRTPISVLKQLGASSSSNVVVAISNVSFDYEHALRHTYKSFSVGQQVRETWVEAAGIKAWRQEMFLVALEAALVRRGWIERWAIQVNAK